MYDFKKTEQEILKFWKEKKIPEKAKNKNKQSKKTFYLMDGPPYATGHIHMGTALNKILKDVSIRMKRMQGYNIFDRAGYDTHGVPIEYQVEKEIGSKGREDIEKFGVKKFIRKCKNFATKFIGVMNKEFEDLGVWMDFKDPYLTLSPEYIEAIWWTFKQAEKKDLLFLGKYSVHVCPRCETAVAYNEIIYTTQEDDAVYVKFPLKNEKNKFLIIWTTTPWTLPGNTGVMVHPNFTYQEIEVHGERWIIAKELVPKIMDELGVKYIVKKEYKGKEMEGWKYKNPLFKNLKIKLKNSYRVVLSSRYVNLDEGTGLVHCAPGHGKEDYEVGKKAGLDMIVPVDISGTLKEETGKYKGKKARVVDAEIIQDLKKDNYLVHKHTYSHDYPLCWRCKTPLLMLAIPQWFFKISDIHKRLLELNKEINWIPKLMEKRMKAWLEGISDWPISRQRYWGTPLPIWICDKCDNKIVVGSIKELEKLYGKKIKELHKPDIDKVKWKCKSCKGEMKRIPEVLDVWFDAGVSSWAALGFPQKKNNFEKFWPANLNTEATDQFRGWWNSQLILSTIAFNKKPFENIMVHGMITDIEKRKMSKSLGNIITPQQMIDKYGRDYLRYYLISVSKGTDFAIDEKAFKDIGKFFNILFNLHKFVSLIGFELKDKVTGKEIEDKWILSRLNSTIKECTGFYNKFLFHKAVEKITEFVIDDLSRTYIHFIRDREDKYIKDILNYCLYSVLKLLAPITPYLSDYLYLKVGGKNSIHLQEFPKQGKIDEKLEKEFEIVFQIIEKGLAERDKIKIGLKWPLASAKIECNIKLKKELQEIIARQLNVKKVGLKKSKEISINLDTKMTPELEAEGYAREISRQIQSFRKKLGLEKKDKIKLFIFTDDKFKKVLEKQTDFIKERTNSKKLEISENVTTGKERFKNNIEFKIRDKRGKIAIILLE